MNRDVVNREVVHRHVGHREFTDLHPEAQKIKLGRRIRIERNWGCDIQDCLPEEIRPRVEVMKGHKARVGEPGSEEEVWWNWSVELLRALEKWSELTSNKLTFAQEMLRLEVQQRQQNPESVQKKIAELLLGDVQRVVSHTRREKQRREREKNKSAFIEEDSDEYDNSKDGSGEFNDAIMRTENPKDIDTEEYTFDPEEPAAVALARSRKRRASKNTATLDVKITEHDNSKDGNDEQGSIYEEVNDGTEDYEDIDTEENTFDPEEPAAVALSRSRRRQASKTTATLDVKIAELHARAARLKAESVRMEARAARLKAESFRMEAAAAEYEADAAEQRSEME